jgi:hypothetical protein
LSWIDDVRSELARADLSPRAARSFALVLALVLFALATWLAVRRLAFAPAAWLASAAAALAASGLFAPSVLRPLHRAWMALGLALGWLASRVVLAVIFYGVVTPLGLVRRVTRRRAGAAPATYWTRRVARPPRYDKMF